MTNDATVRHVHLLALQGLEAEEVAWQLSMAVRDVRKALIENVPIGFVPRSVEITDLLPLSTTPREEAATEHGSPR